jgi:indolepyruvate ferredoxin oxidoreductase
MRAEAVTLEDKYTRTEGQIFLTGIQALVRLSLLQSQRDRANGLHTAGFISGYRGSPLAGLDRQLWAAREHLERGRIHFSPGVNEELGATAVWGSQQVNAYAGARYDGVFGMWYGKAPGVDRASDALKHANASGSSRYGGVLAVAGDDHACKSSTLPSQSEFALMDAGIPVLNPSGVQDVLEFGLKAWALSRFSGLWVGMIALADTMDSAASVHLDPSAMATVAPEIERPPEGLNFRPGIPPLRQEEILYLHRRPAAQAWVRVNGIDRIAMDAPNARLGIVTTGKAHLDLLQALDDLGIDAATAQSLGLRVLKIGMSWPLDREIVRRFADGLEEILVVEEKRSFVETQLKETLYGTANAPRVVGKEDERGVPLLGTTADLTPARVARALAARLPEGAHRDRLAARLAELEARERALERAGEASARAPFYCSGCPHNRSTVIPEGSRGLAGIGCHYMVQWMDRNTDTYSQMGGEGAAWIGQAPFTTEPHVFANLGDGTYFHSGILAIRAAVSADVNMTYKILFNDAVAMTGGQGVDGTLTVPQLTRQLAAEGVRHIAVMSDDPEGYGADAGFAPGTAVHHRRELDAVQKRLRETPGCTVLVYDQTCAAELRRRRKRGLAPDPAHRVFINQDVCEGCGDCSVQSNCMSVEPVETELGRKRRINQSSCNKDLSCVDGLCPAFVSVLGAEPRRQVAALADDAFDCLPLPVRRELDEPWNLLVTGIGGTGVVTLGALIGTAAHMDGLAATTLDQTGLAQKGGAVTSHVRLAPTPEHLHTPRIPVARADALLACDLIVAAGTPALEKLNPERTESVINTHLVPTAEFVLDNDVRYDADALADRVGSESRATHQLDASELARRLLGDTIAANALLLGYAFQKGLVPLRLESLERAIELNGVAVELNLRALALGRLAAASPEKLPAPHEPAVGPETLDERIDLRERKLIAYQSRGYAARYRRLVERVRAAEEQNTLGSSALSEAVAKSYHKLLAYKDEYEVARLYTDGAFERALAEEFETPAEVRFELAPPLWARRDPETGRPVKKSYGRWMLSAMRVLARLRFLRGTRLDPFGRTEERRLERELILDYERTVETLLTSLSPENHALAIEIASLPLEIRGFDRVKLDNAARVRDRETLLLEEYAKEEPAAFAELPIFPAERRPEEPR